MRQYGERLSTVGMIVFIVSYVYFIVRWLVEVVFPFIAQYVPFTFIFTATLYVGFIAFMVGSLVVIMTIDEPRIVFDHPLIIDIPEKEDEACKK